MGPTSGRRAQKIKEAGGASAWCGPEEATLEDGEAAPSYAQELGDPPWLASGGEIGGFGLLGTPRGCVSCECYSTSTNLCARHSAMPACDMLRGNGTRALRGKCRWCCADIAAEQATPEYRAAQAANVAASQARMKARAEKKKAAQQKRAQKTKEAQEAQARARRGIDYIFARTGRATSVPATRTRARVPEGLART